jgi:SAM-dependent methyltransferase
MLAWKTIRHSFSAAAAEARYDRRFGVDTAGFIPGLEAGADGASGVGYLGTPPAIAEYLIRQIGERARGATFVDIGAGKGRVLLIAARHPFARVVGVELTETLARIARQNAEVMARRIGGLAPIEVIHGDATEYVLPDGPCVLFFYRPFTGEIAESVSRNIVESAHNNPRPITIIYYTQEFPNALRNPLFIRRDLTDLPSDRMERFRNFGFRAAIFEAG